MNVDQLKGKWKQLRGEAKERWGRLTDDDLLRRHVITRLMCDSRLDYAAIEEAFGIDFHETFADALAEITPLADDGLVTRDEHGLTLTFLGRLLVRNVCMPFDRYLREGAGQRFSRTV